MKIKVLKFGGSSLAESRQFKKVANIIKADTSRRYIIASAPGKRNEEDQKVTDLLHETYILAENGKNIEEAFKKIEERFNKIASELQLDFSLEDEFEIIKSSISNNIGLDYVLSRGEYLNSMILAKYIGYEFIDPKGKILFLENGKLDREKTNLILEKTLQEHKRAVIPGFYGSMASGEIKTFSRGGSDITGSIVARAVEADVYENWTDVSGMLMADPRIVESPQVIEKITYKELRELSYMGATIMHDEAIFPVKESGIPINIRNTNLPEDKGTMIVEKATRDDKDRMITGVAGKKGFSTIHIEKDMMNLEVGFGRRVLQVLEDHGIAFEHMPTGIDTISIIVNSTLIEGKEDLIQEEICKAVNPDLIHIEEGLAMIAVVGRAMINEKGVARRVFSSIEEASINIKMIDQGSSEINIIIGVREEDYIPALRTIYSEFVD